MTARTYAIRAADAGRDGSGPVSRRLRAGETHLVVHALERRSRGGAGLSGAEGEHPLELALVAPELLVALLDRHEELHDRFGDVLLEPAVATAVVTRLELGDPLPGRHGHDLEQVRDPGLLLGGMSDVGAGVRDRRLELLADDVGRVDEADDALRRAAGGRHQALRLLEVADAPPFVRDRDLGDDERLAEALVEALGDIARQLDVLA